MSHGYTVTDHRSPRRSRSDVTESNDFKLLRREAPELEELFDPNLQRRGKNMAGHGGKVGNHYIVIVYVIDINTISILCDYYYIDCVT